MSNPIHPLKREKLITMQITAREANMLEKLRASSGHGKVVIQKANGFIVRIETHESILIDDKWREVL